MAQLTSMEGATATAAASYCVSLPTAGNCVTRAAWPLLEPAGSSQCSHPSMMFTLQMSLLRVKNGYPVSVGDIVATVEDEPQVGTSNCCVLQACA